MTDHTARSRQDRKPKLDPAAPPKRRAKGFARASDLVTPTLKQAGARRGFAELRLLTEWRVVVGDALAQVCRPLRVSYKGRTSGLGATLHVTAEGARAPELAMQEPQIIERVNQFYGYRAISRLRIDQSRSDMMAAPSGTGFAEPAGRYAHPGGSGHPALAGGMTEPAAHRGAGTGIHGAGIHGTGIQGGDVAAGQAPLPIEGVEDERLRRALARLGANVAAKSKRLRSSEGSLTGPAPTADRS